MAPGCLVCCPVRGTLGVHGSPVRITEVTIDDGWFTIRCSDGQAWDSDR